MGLDITYYERVELTEPHEVTDDCFERDDHVLAFVHEGFEQSLRGLLADRCYVTSGETGSFRAGSYSGYNRWRDALSLAALAVPARVVFETPDEYRDRPFFELINFADNEGTIGPEAAEDLAADFRHHAAAVRASLAALSDGDYYVTKYDEWQKAFTVAAGSGLVLFR